MFTGFAILIDASKGLLEMAENCVIAGQNAVSRRNRSTGTCLPLPARFGNERAASQCPAYKSPPLSPQCPHVQRGRAPELACIFAAELVGALVADLEGDGRCIAFA